jgi:hypothetical protein
MTSIFMSVIFAWYAQWIKGRALYPNILHLVQGLERLGVEYRDEGIRLLTMPT